MSGDPNVTARAAADTTVDLLHDLQAHFDGPTAVAAALAVAVGALGYVRDAIGDGAAEAAADMMRAAVAHRQDRARPVKEAC